MTRSIMTRSIMTRDMKGTHDNDDDDPESNASRHAGADDALYIHILYILYWICTVDMVTYV